MADYFNAVRKVCNNFYFEKVKVCNNFYFEKKFIAHSIQYRV